MSGTSIVFPATLTKPTRQEVHRLVGVIAPPLGCVWRHQSAGEAPQRRLTVSLVDAAPAAPAEPVAAPPTPQAAPLPLPAPPAATTGLNAQTSRFFSRLKPLPLPVPPGATTGLNAQTSGLFARLKRQAEAKTLVRDAPPARRRRIVLDTSSEEEPAAEAWESARKAAAEAVDDERLLRPAPSVLRRPAAAEVDGEVPIVRVARGRVIWQPPRFA